MRPAILSLSVCLILSVLAPDYLAMGEVRFGEPASGMQVALEVLPDRGFRLHLRNRGALEVELNGGFVWLLIAQSRQNASYTQKIPLPPKALAADEVHTSEVSFNELSLYPYRPGTKLAQGYPSEAEPPASVSADAFSATARTQAIVYLNLSGEPVLLRSRAQEVAAGKPTTRPSLLAEFKRDAFAAKAAHEQAIAAGADGLPDLAMGLQDPDMPEFGRMWIATAIIRVNAGNAPELAASMTSHSSAGVRHVLAYHGPGMNSQTVNQAIVRFASAGTDPLFTAWAARGFVERGQAFPQDLILAATRSSEPRARAQAAHVLAKQKDAKRLATLARDDNEIVRIAVINAMSEQRFRPSEVIDALKESLSLPGESARESTVRLLSQHTGQAWHYSPELPQEQRLKTLEAIRLYFR